MPNYSYNGTKMQTNNEHMRTRIHYISINTFANEIYFTKITEFQLPQIKGGGYELLLIQNVTETKLNVRTKSTYFYQFNNTIEKSD